MKSFFTLNLKISCCLPPKKNPTFENAEVSPSSIKEKIGSTKSNVTPVSCASKTLKRERRSSDKIQPIIDQFLASKNVKHILLNLTKDLIKAFNSEDANDTLTQADNMTAIRIQDILKDGLIQHSSYPRRNEYFKTRLNLENISRLLRFKTSIISI